MSEKFKDAEAKEYREIVDEEITENSLKRFSDYITDLGDRKENLINSKIGSSEWEIEWRTLNDSEE
jgi:hypothetical protein